MALTPDCAQSALPLAEKFAANGLVLVPFDGTALSELVETGGHALAECLPGGAENLAENLVVIANTSDAVDSDVPNMHQSVMNRYEEMISEAVQQHFLVARTIVSPAVREFTERVTATLGQLTPSELLGVEIVPYRLPEFMTNANFESEFRRYEDLSFNPPSLNLQLPSLSTEEVLEALKIGSGGLDNAIAEWAAGVGHARLKALWDETFTQTLLDHEPRGFRKLVDDVDTGLDNALAMFLWARKLHDNPPENTDMALERYNDAMADIRDQAGAKLSRIVQELDRAKKAGTLVKTQNGKKTVVYGNVYDEFLEGEGSNELIFGNALSERPHFTVANILEKAEELTKLWNRHVTYVQHAEQQNKFSRMVEALEIEFRRMLNEAEGEDLEREKMIIMDLFFKELKTLNPQEEYDLDDVCLRLMCRSRFYKTKSEDILCSIERNMKDNPTIDVREAAALALIDYVAGWIAKLIKVQ